MSDELLSLAEQCDQAAREFEDLRSFYHNDLRTTAATEAATLILVRHGPLFKHVAAALGDLACKIVSYDDAHMDAVRMGYPSLTEALEHLDELRSARSRRTAEAQPATERKPQ